MESIFCFLKMISRCLVLTFIHVQRRSNEKLFIIWENTDMMMLVMGYARDYIKNDKTCVDLFDLRSIKVGFYK